MKVSGFTIARNIRKYRYPFLESIRSILPICDEFIVNVGDSDDDTLSMAESMADPKIRIVRNAWDNGMGKEVLSFQTNQALKECSGDWAFYLQADEVVHEKDLPRLKRVMLRALHRPVDALKFRWLHFYGNYCRYRVDAGWYQKQSRIIRNRGEVESVGDAYSFARKDGRPLREWKTGCFIYHYGWVQPGEVMTRRRSNAQHLGFAVPGEKEEDRPYDYGDLDRFPVYYGPHPAVMRPLVERHELSRRDWAGISRRKWWHPFVYLRPRWKTWRREKRRLT
jgi:glycosyltransferase involved in cell wall biosynthesis